MANILTTADGTEFKPNRRQRIRAYRLKQLLGKLPVKPEARVTNKHEYIRLEDVKDTYPESGQPFTPSQLDLKLTELKSNGRKVLNSQREWGGWTIKMMALKAQSSVDVNTANDGNS